MKRQIIIALGIVLSAILWAAAEDTNSIQLKTQFQAHTRLELKTQEKLQQKLSVQECDQLMLKVKTQARSQSEYQEQLKYLNQYMQQNRNQWKLENVENAWKFYQENEAQLSGTPRQKRLMLMTQLAKTEKLQQKSAVMNKLELKKMTKTQLKEASLEQSQYRYQTKNQIQQKKQVAQKDIEVARNPGIHH